MKIPFEIEAFKLGSLFEGVGNNDLFTLLFLEFLFLGDLNLTSTKS